MNKFRCSNNGVGITLFTTGTSQSALTVGDGPALMCANPNSHTIHIVWGDTLPLVATNTGYPILPRTKEAVDIPADALYVAVIGVDPEDGETAPLHVHRGYEILLGASAS